MNYQRFLMASTLLVASGCSTTYIEKPTPTASIAPPPAIQQPQIQEIARTAPGEPMAGSGLYGGQMSADAGVAAGTIRRFSEAYAHANKPRIAIFLNRALSDDVREWHTDARAVVSGDGSVSRSRENLLGRTEETVKGNVAVAAQTAAGNASGRRSSPGEEYLWPLEDGFMQQFLRGGAILVDRAVILRLTSRGESQRFDAIETKKVEMDALVNHADIFIELLVTRSPSAPGGYEFKATAKEVRTGRILANTTSLNWNIGQSRPQKVVVTSNGYEVTDDPAFPRVQLLSRDLANDLMNMLVTAWEGR